MTKLYDEDVSLSIKAFSEGKEDNCYSELNGESEPITDTPTKSIKAIDKTTVHKICSGQVVLTLATAVKELVENSIDAGATTVEIRLLECGSTLIEVTDNGKGVEPCDFEGLTLKHHTSKLEDFGDLIGVKTFGFRGEALSSLCALSDLSIITRHTNQAVGTKLIYNTNGSLIEKVPLSRQIGTTVSLQNLFYTLPVRHKEFLRNLKREFTKMVQVLYSYCLITTDVRIICTNQVGKNKVTVVSTECQSSLKDNIISIFGPKQIASLLEISQKDPSEDILSEYKIMDKCDKKLFDLRGFISSCTHGRGRSSADRQFYFINNRPCDPSKVMRLINDVYHHYNKHQFPMVVLNIGMEEGDVDVNVTPDKRQILVNREKLLLATIKTTLISLYEDIPSTFSIKSHSVPVFSSPSTKLGLLSTPPSNPKLSCLSQRFSRTPSGSESPNLNVGLRVIKSTSPSYSGIKRSLSSNSELLQGSSKQPKLQDYSFNISNSSESSLQKKTLALEKGGERISFFDDEEFNVNENQNLNDDEKKDSSSLVQEDGISGNSSNKGLAYIKQHISEEQTFEPSQVHFSTENRVISNTGTPRPSCKEIHLKTNAFLSSLRDKKINSCKEFQKPNCSKGIPQDEVIILKNDDEKSEIRCENDLSEESKSSVIYDDEEIAKMSLAKKSLKISFSLDSLRHKIRRTKSKKLSHAQQTYRKFRAQISPTENQTAEQELKKEISKESFKQMEILGQFNLGFIIAKLNSDLFIIDQHATDEKYNFETLQKTCVLQNQKLIIPQTLELTPTNEGILIDNMDIFVKNGFEFEVDSAKEIGRRVMLKSMPHSRGWEFNRDDVEEMIFMLSDSPGVMCRPSRINAMFASRACRKSVMIGTHLGISQMRKLIDHMGEMDQPWNCPHGRPTIRHLINLSILKLD